MKKNEELLRTIEMNHGIVSMIDQNKLPFEFKIVQSYTYSETCQHIKRMTVRGAGAIGAAAGFAMAQAFLQAKSENFETYIIAARKEIEQTRPTAKNLFYAVEKVYKAGLISHEKALEKAQQLAHEDEEACYNIGYYGNEIISQKANIATHCNAGSLAFVRFGTALAPIYRAFAQQKEVHIWVDETRPRNQGARLTAWELSQANIPHTIIADNATAFLIQQRKIDMVIVGADRIAANGATANKIGTLEKALAAKYFNIPFYVAAPSSTFDIDCKIGDDIPIEYRSEDEVLWISGQNKTGLSCEISTSNPGSKACNPAFDITPAELITGFITEKGIIKPNRAAIGKLLLNI
ncbi:MAG: S-methyl-5-thioribose-1-phosphate isomerase [Bacteroidales bacterium]|nr:S-methyl-5-thioribose-1-phosphate isomerase [Bacteroidales bacterium]MDD4575031.1 S-methyl-5-thioribose-1-phosphate isomerase [Bacteroidales bacterium]